MLELFTIYRHSTRVHIYPISLSPPASSSSSSIASIAPYLSSSCIAPVVILLLKLKKTITPHSLIHTYTSIHTHIHQPPFHVYISHYIKKVKDSLLQYPHPLPFTFRVIVNHPFLVVWLVVGGTNTKILGTESPKKATCLFCCCLIMNLKPAPL